MALICPNTRASLYWILVKLRNILPQSKVGHGISIMTSKILVTMCKIPESIICQFILYRYTYNRFKHFLRHKSVSYEPCLSLCQVWAMDRKCLFATIYQRFPYLTKDALIKCFRYLDDGVHHLLIPNEKKIQFTISKLLAIRSSYDIFFVFH